MLVLGVERRCHVATDPNPAAGRPMRLYGNAFERADEAMIRLATTRLDPPTTTNLIAIAAPRGGRGRYDRATIEHILVTAFSGFRAAVLESERHRGRPVPTILHTGFWGCGAFGGNRVLMALLQLLAAALAGLDLVVFHTVNAAGTHALTDARKVIEGSIASNEIPGPDDLLDAITQMGFEWGVGDGT